MYIPENTLVFFLKRVTCTIDDADLLSTVNGWSNGNIKHLLMPYNKRFTNSFKDTRCCTRVRFTCHRVGKVVYKVNVFNLYRM